MSRPDRPRHPGPDRQTPPPRRHEPLPPLPSLPGPGGPGPGAPVPPEGARDTRPGHGRPYGAADPVKALMHRHRELCEQAVHPLEIAAGLEAHGVTDRTAARYRHRDVFSLAEEMYARVPRDDAGPAPRTAPAADPAARVARTLLPLMPGTLCAAAVAGVRLTGGHLRPAVAVAGLLTVALTLHLALRRGPLSLPAGVRARRTLPCTRVWTCWLLLYALLGDGLLAGILGGGPDSLPDGTAHGPWPTATAPVLALALGLAPATWGARLLTVRARRRLAASRGLGDFSHSARSLLPVTLAVYLGALAGLLALTGALLHEPVHRAHGLALGALLLLARLLTVHGSTRAPKLAIGLTAGAEAAALALPLTARLPGCAALAAPVDLLAGTWGPGSIPALLCAAAALALLGPATHTLTRASAYAAPDDAP